MFSNESNDTAGIDSNPGMKTGATGMSSMGGGGGGGASSLAA